MVAEVVSKPELNSIIFRFLLAHAEQPELLADSENPFLAEFAKKPSFYLDFITQVGSTIEPEIGGKVYDESRLLQIDNWIPQKKFKEILTCFKEISGIWNPLHYRELGKVIPFVQSGFTEIAGPTLLNPARVIKESAKYNHSLNNDSKLVVESLRKNGAAEARIQHYFLPSGEPHYLEMVTAALGYWEGIPLLWDWHKLGKANLFEVQIALEDLITNDYSYLDLQFEERKGEIYINGELKGRRALLDIDYMPQQDYLTRKLSEFSPIEITEDVEVDGDLIFPAGTKYGMPCNRYDLSIPDPGWGRRAWYTVKRIAGREGKGFQFMDKNVDEIAASSRLLAPQYEAIKRQNVEIEEEKSRAQAAEARAETEMARADAAEATTMAEKARADNAELEVQIKATEAELAQAETAHVTAKRTADQRMIEFSKNARDTQKAGHNNKNKTMIVRSAGQNLFARVLEEHDYTGSWTEEDLIIHMKEILGSYTPQEGVEPNLLVTGALHFRDLLEATDNMRINNEVIMGKEMKLEIVLSPFQELMEPIIYSLTRQPKYKGIEVVRDIPPDILINGDIGVLNDALTNILDNCMEASLPIGEIKIAQRQVDALQRTVLKMEIYQTGFLAPENVILLNQGKIFSTKKDGHGIGSSSSHTIITDRNICNGRIRYRALNDGQYPAQQPEKFYLAKIEIKV